MEFVFRFLYFAPCVRSRYKRGARLYVYACTMQNGKEKKIMKRERKEENRNMKSRSTTSVIFFMTEHYFFVLHVIKARYLSKRYKKKKKSFIVSYISSKDIWIVFCFLLFIFKAQQSQIPFLFEKQNFR
jgi:hypothetical protein